MTEPHIQKIAGRNGVIGLIACDHYMTDGIRERTQTFEQSMDVVSRHIDKLAGLTGSHAHTALGSDWDGFIKPTLAGLEVPLAFPRVRDFLSQRYGSDVAEQIWKFTYNGPVTLSSLCRDCSFSELKVYEAVDELVESQHLDLSPAGASKKVA